MKMKAIKVIKPFDVQIVEVEKPEIKKGTDVIVKITSGGICGSDIGIWNGTNSLATYPRIIGHEFGGIVVEIGKDVKNIKVGDKVAVDPVVSCGECYACKIGRHNVCSTLEVMGVHRDGGFAEYINVDEKNIHKFSFDFEDSLLGLVEPYTIGMQINNRLNIVKEDKVLIMGAGPIGITALQVAKGRGAKVIITDIVKERLDKALEFGANEVVLIGKDNLEQKLNEFTMGEGIPVIIDTVCTPKSLEEAVQLVCPAGRIAVIGLKNQPSSLTMADITKKELTIVGSRLNCNCFDQVIQEFKEQKLNPEKLMTKSYNYKNIMDALNLIKDYPQEVLKIVLKFED